jgi:hypothetical protein
LKDGHWRKHCPRYKEVRDAAKADGNKKWTSNKGAYDMSGFALVDDA